MDELVLRFEMPAHRRSDVSMQRSRPTNPAWQTVTINDSELTHFSQRVMTFTRRR